jgi:hypothetical protein
VQPPCNPLNEDYTKIFCMTDEAHITSIQCKMRLSGLKSMRKIDSLSLIFTDLYVRALTSGLHSTETALQLSENSEDRISCIIYKS